MTKFAPGDIRSRGRSARNERRFGANLLKLDVLPFGECANVRNGYAAPRPAGFLTTAGIRLLKAAS
jgi:hypothetical protein